MPAMALPAQRSKPFHLHPWRLLLFFERMALHQVLSSDACVIAESLSCSIDIPAIVTSAIDVPAIAVSVMAYSFILNTEIPLSALSLLQKRQSRLTWLRALGLALTGLAVAHAQILVDEASLSETLFEAHKDSVYRVETINTGSDKKSALGTGFVVSEAHLLTTNFHVVSAVVHDPANYRLEFLSNDGKRGSLNVVAVDVVHDLALVQAKESLGTPFHVGQLTRKGTPVFSLGHPLALDLSIISGTANGLLEKSLYDKILFSGNINPGMSGGPAITAKGEVIGVNVATSGNGVGYLVPSNYLQALISHYNEQKTIADSADLQKNIGEQLQNNQQELIDDLLSKTWQTQVVGHFKVPAELSSRLDCWGETQPLSEKQPYTQSSTNCNGQDDIYVSERQRAGSISYQYFWLESSKLSPRAFYHLYQAQHNSQFQSEANETDVGKFRCSVQFVKVAKQSFKANICSRAYKRYEGLQDVMVLMAMTGHAQQGFLFTLDMSAVTVDNGLKLLKSFLEHFSWQP